MSEEGCEVVSTGNKELDQILKGGFPLNSINVIMGEPGSGKTIFAEQMVFSQAKKTDRKILYITTLSEPLAKILKYLQRFEFYDADLVSKKVHYIDIGQRLATEGIDCLVPILKEAIFELEPELIVIDSFKALHDLSSPLEMRRMLFELTGMLTAYASTVFLLGEYTEKHAKKLPEFAIADGIMQFMRHSLTTRDERYIRVLKLRGGSYLEGMHGFHINNQGLEVYPRLVSPEVPEDYTISGNRAKSGIEGFDQLADGGLLEGSTTLVAGSTGSGKTTFGLQFVLQGIREGENCLYVNFQENPTQLARVIERMGGDTSTLKEQGLHMFYMSPVELQIDSIIVTIFKLIRELDIKRVVVDSVGDLISAASDPGRIHDYLYAMSQHFSVCGVTTLLTFETLGGASGANFNLNGERFSYMADCVLFLDVGDRSQFARTLSILKQRASNHAHGAKDLLISQSGLKVTDKR